MMRLSFLNERRPEASGPETIRPRNLRLLFVLTTSFLLIAAVYTSVLIVKRQHSLPAVSRYNVSWLLSQAALEVAKLSSIAASSAIPGTVIDKENIQLWLDVVDNRVQLLSSGE